MLREYDIELSYEEYANQYAGIPTTSNAVTIVENYSIDTSPAELVKAKNMLPDCYLLAAEKLGLEPSECLDIEDTYNGSLAAIGAGIKCIGVSESSRVRSLFTETICECTDLNIATKWISETLN